MRSDDHVFPSCVVCCFGVSFIFFPKCEILESEIYGVCLFLPRYYVISNTEEPSHSYNSNTIWQPVLQASSELHAKIGFMPKREIVNKIN